MAHVAANREIRATTVRLLSQFTNKLSVLLTLTGSTRRFL